MTFSNTYNGINRVFFGHTVDNEKNVITEPDQEEKGENHLHLKTHYYQC